MELFLRGDRTPRPTAVPAAPEPPAASGAHSAPQDDKPTLRLRQDAPLILYLDPPSFAAEQYRALAVQVEERINPIGTWGFALTVTSPVAADGKTLTSLNLALTLTRGEDRKVLLLEADLWRPRLHTYLEGEPDHPGLRQLLERGATLADAALPVEGTGLHILLAGSRESAGDLISGRRMSEVLNEARAAYEIVVIDSPPMEFLASARSLAARADGAVVVVRAGQTHRRAIEKTLAALGQEKTIGVVLNGVKPSKRGYGTRNYY